MADIRNFNGNESKTKQKNPLRKQSNLRLLKMKIQQITKRKSANTGSVICTRPRW